MRPEGWKKGIKPSNKNTYTTDGMNQMYEAGADAMLEGLKKAGVDYREPSIVCAEDGTVTYRGKQGYLVFIPGDTIEYSRLNTGPFPLHKEEE